MINEQNLYIKSHGLGNDYIVMDQASLSFTLSPKAIEHICDVHYGIGSDGILLKVPTNKADFGLKIYNPDGSEAEKSGNGLRIFGKYLYDHGHAQSKTFTIDTLGGIVKAEVIETTATGKAQVLRIDIGTATFNSKEIPVSCEEVEALSLNLTIQDQHFDAHCASVGNPHCVIFKETLKEDEIKKWGPLLEHHAMFPNRINVQFAKVLDRNTIEILIWERGAGYTLASGSSSSAVASIARKLGYVDDKVRVLMPGGELNIEFSNRWDIKLTGAVREIATGNLSEELINDVTN